MKRTLSLCILFIALGANALFAQAYTSDETPKKHFVSSSFFMLFNLLPNPPSFYQLNYGYRFSPKDALIVEAITWKYNAPLGIPYGPSYEQPEERFPGYARDYGVGLAYQRFLYKGFYSMSHAMPFYQEYRNPDKGKIGTGFMLFLTQRFGYHVKLFNNQLFVEPSVAITHWPINTNMPESFQKLENKWNNYFLFEPGLHVGIKF